MAKRKNNGDSVYDRLEELLGDDDRNQESLAQMQEAKSNGGMRNLNIYRWYTGYARLPRGCIAFFFFGSDATQGWVVQTGQLTAAEKLDALNDLKKRRFTASRLTGMGRALNRAIAEHERALGNSSGSSTVSGNASASYSGSGSASSSYSASG